MLAPFIKKHIATIIPTVVAVALTLWLTGCPPRTRSPINPDKKLTRFELQAEMTYTISKFQAADLDLDSQEAFRKLLLQNALAIASTGTVNPLGIITGLAALYGVTRAGKDGITLIKNRHSNTTT